jgi:hypothetical protein
MSEIWQLSAAEMAHRIARRELSSAEVVDAHLARIDAVNPTLNAVVRILADEARAGADGLTSCFSEAPTTDGPCLSRLQREATGPSRTWPNRSPRAASTRVDARHGAEAAKTLSDAPAERDAGFLDRQIGCRRHAGQRQRG